ncbi:hypothetical protein A2382_01600 [Candidatus Woesebacteria bacterium RIFOXYB1_FULL_38_16]|uniref:Uncharacterized protein n=1 Tax=Candidatus Woesebacteria bacterium RIFOXYB1_FULL_38_16 TaxID=1802538 RepID=A0A1F8CWD7_9BACT|nr:MAG: hypothetical protein A2382_01600 [Candidatus Woesebacteria bacterium RIFOXYB1_FULL_38_16]
MKLSEYKFTKKQALIDRRNHGVIITAIIGIIAVIISYKLGQIRQSSWLNKRAFERLDTECLHQLYDSESKNN